MRDIVITGASRGIGRALALALAAHPPFPMRLVLSARDETALDAVASEASAAGTQATTVTGDLSTLSDARALGVRLSEEVTAPTILVHNAGIWPTRRSTTGDGYELAYAVNFAGPFVAQQVLLDRELLDRVMVVSAGLIAFGRFDKDRTPTGRDFSMWRTYCTTKMAFAIAEREIAARSTDVDFVMLHPGVVRTDLAISRGWLGRIARLAKRFWEAPDVTGERLSTFFARDRWSPAGAPRWFIEDREQPWPEATENPRHKAAVLEAAEQLSKHAET